MTMESRPTVAYQGAPGAYSHEACLRLAPHLEPVACPDFAGAIAAVAGGACECALLPVENNTAGMVPGVSAMIADAGLHVIADAWLPIRHQLMVNAGVAMVSVRTVHSHPMALAQCGKAIARLRLQAVEAFDTAGAAQALSQTEDPSMAVIASRAAAEIYGLDILLPNIEDDPSNATLFAVVSRAPRPDDR
jgi:prephenate dehydratase